MMGHDHAFRIRDDFTRPDNGIRQVERQCVCGLSERRRYDGEDVISVRYRYTPAGGGWVEAAELLKVVLPVRLCDECGGGDVGCEKCGGLLVVEDDGRPLDAAPPRSRRIG